MKNIKLLLISSVFMLVACGEYHGYDADDAQSPYIPNDGVYMVKSLKTTSVYAGREYSWEHEFKYDAHNRVKEVASNILYHVERYVGGVKGFYKCNRKSSAQYYYLNDAIDVTYSVAFEYPGHSDWNIEHNGTDEGVFNEDGFLKKFSALDFGYSGSVLAVANSDGGRRYEITRDRNNNVTGFNLFDEYTDSLMVDNADECGYLLQKNNTNFDFSGYFGFWGVEEEIVANASPYYAAYQLAAFGMLGTTSKYLPLGKAVVGEEIKTGKWELDDKQRPVMFTDSSGRKTVVTYMN